jgi:hypothetical protein
VSRVNDEIVLRQSLHFRRGELLLESAEQRLIGRGWGGLAGTVTWAKWCCARSRCGTGAGGFGARPG